MKKAKRVWKIQWLDTLIIRERVWRWRMSDRLGAWVARARPERLRVWFVIFFMSMGLLYTWLFIRALADETKVTFVQPLVRSQPVQGVVLHDTGLSKRRDAEKAQLRRLLDRINGDPELKQGFDSLLKARPGFADTLQKVEGMMGLGK